MLLDWDYNHDKTMIAAPSPAGAAGKFRILRDGDEYWDSFSGISPTGDLDSIKKSAQRIHDSYINTIK